MHTLIVTSSRSRHANTPLVAQAMAGPLAARVVPADELRTSDLRGVGRIGLGSGVYWWRLDPVLLQCARRLAAGESEVREAFVFATSGLPVPVRSLVRPLVQALDVRGIVVKGTFVCRGIDTWGPFGWVGGVARRHPDAEDLDAARAFAGTLSSG